MMKWYASGVTLALLVALAFIWKLEISAVDSKHRSVGVSAAPLEKQRECSQQAEKTVHSLGWGKQQSNVIVDYVSHYNIELNRCFVEIAITDLSNVAATGGPVETLSVTDAFERRDFGDYISWSIKGQDARHVAQCDALPPGKPRKICHSEDEWNDLMRPYMGDDLIP